MTCWRLATCLVLCILDQLRYSEAFLGLAPLPEITRGSAHVPFRQQTKATNAPTVQAHVLQRRQLAGLTTVGNGLQLLQALRDSSTSFIVCTQSISLADSSDWADLEKPVLISRRVVILGGGRYGTAAQSPDPSGPYVALDWGHLAGKVQLAGPVAINQTQPGGAFNSIATISLVGLWLRNYQPPSGFGLTLFSASSSAGAAVHQEDCVLERFAGLPLNYTLAEADALPPVSGQPKLQLTVLDGSCPLAAAPPPSDTSPFDSSCFRRALHYASLAAVVPASAVPSPGTLPGAGSANAEASGILLTISNCTYGVRHEVDPACVQAFGADYCVYRLEAQQLASAPPPPETVTEGGGGGSGGGGLSAGASAGIAAAATLVGCLAVLLLVRFVGRIRKGHRTLTLAVRPPGATPNTTLLITDIQNSTNLWEQLPTNVMNEALRLHHRCLRALLLKCNGYESATEGDSFILAFHTPLDASRFALLAQQALMELSWPSELLDHEDGREVWVEPARPKVVAVGRIAGASSGPGQHHHKSLGLGALVGVGGPPHHGDSGYTQDDMMDADANGSLYDTPMGGQNPPAQAQNVPGWLSAAFGSQLRSGPTRRGMPGRGPSLLPRNRSLSRSFSNSGDRPSMGPFGASGEAGPGRQSLQQVGDGSGRVPAGSRNGMGRITPERLPAGPAGRLHLAASRALEGPGRSWSDAAVAAAKARQEMLELLPESDGCAPRVTSDTGPGRLSGTLPGGATAAAAAVAAAAVTVSEAVPRVTARSPRPGASDSLAGELTLLQPVTPEGLLLMATQTRQDIVTGTQSTLSVPDRPGAGDEAARPSHSQEQRREPPQRDSSSLELQVQRLPPAGRSDPPRCQQMPDVTLREVRLPPRGGSQLNVASLAHPGGATTSRTGSSSGYSCDGQLLSAAYRPAAIAAASLPASRVTVGSSAGAANAICSGSGSSRGISKILGGLVRMRIHLPGAGGGKGAATAAAAAPGAVAGGGSSSGAAADVVVFPGWGAGNGGERDEGSSRAGSEILGGSDALVWSSNPLSAMPGLPAGEPPRRHLTPATLRGAPALAPSGPMQLHASPSAGTIARPRTGGQGMPLLAPRRSQGPPADGVRTGAGDGGGGGGGKGNASNVAPCSVVHMVGASPSGAAPAAAAATTTAAAAAEATQPTLAMTPDPSAGGPAPQVLSGPGPLAEGLQRPEAVSDPPLRPPPGSWRLSQGMEEEGRPSPGLQPSSPRRPAAQGASEHHPLPDWWGLPLLPARPGSGPVAEGAEEVHPPGGFPTTLLAQAQQLEEHDGGGLLVLSTDDFTAPAAAVLAPPPMLARGLCRKASFGASIPLVPSRLGPRPSNAAASAAAPAPSTTQTGISVAAAGHLAAPGLYTADDAGGANTGPSELRLRHLLPAAPLDILSPAATSNLLALLSAPDRGSGATRGVGSATAAAAKAALPAGAPQPSVFGSAAASSAPVLLPPQRPVGQLLHKRSTQELMIASSAAAVGGAASSCEAEGGELLFGRRSSTDLLLPVSGYVDRRLAAAWAAANSGLPAGPAPASPWSSFHSQRPPQQPARAPHVDDEQRQADHERARPHTIHGYQRPQPAMQQASGLSNTGVPRGDDETSPEGPGGAQRGRKTFNPAIIRKGLEMIPLPTKLPEVRQSWKELCASNWPLVALPPRAIPRKTSCSFDYQSPRFTAPGFLMPHAEEEDGDEEDGHQHHQQQQGPHGYGGGAKAAGRSPVMILRGFRVRMGLHTGIPLTTDVTFNHTTGHMAYSGMPLKVAKAVGDGAAGGSVLMSNTTFNAVHPHLADLPGHPEVLYCGDAQVELVIRSLYMLQSRELHPRLGYLPALRNLKMLQRGNLEAPVGTVAICFMTVAGATKAVAELGPAAVSALQQFKSIVTRDCCECGGFVVEATDGLCLAAFTEPAAAAIWALRCKEALAAHSWAAELLSSRHFSEVREYTKIHRGRGMPSRRVANVISRGPRIRTGIAVGPVTAEVSSATGRLAYRGKVMNRSARVAAQAADGQVLLSQAAWQRVVATVGVRTLSEFGKGAAALATPAVLAMQLSGLSGISSAAPPDSASRVANPAGPAPLSSDGALLHSGCPSPIPAHVRTSAMNTSGTAAGPTSAPAAVAAAMGKPQASQPLPGPGGRNLLLLAAEQLLYGAADGDSDREREREEVEALVSEAAAVTATLPSLPGDLVLAGSSAGRFTLKGVAEAQELFEIRMEPAPALASLTPVAAGSGNVNGSAPAPAPSAAAATLPQTPSAAEALAADGPASGSRGGAGGPVSATARALQPSPLPRQAQQSPSQQASPTLWSRSPQLQLMQTQQWSSGPVPRTAVAAASRGVPTFGSSYGGLPGGDSFGNARQQGKLSLDAWKMGGPAAGTDAAAITGAFAAAYAASVAPLNRAASGEADEPRVLPVGTSPWLSAAYLAPAQPPPEGVEPSLGATASQQQRQQQQQQHHQLAQYNSSESRSNEAADEAGRQQPFGAAGVPVAEAPALVPGVGSAAQGLRTGDTGRTGYPAGSVDPHAATDIAATTPAAGAPNAAPTSPAKELAGDALLEALAAALMSEGEDAEGPGEEVVQAKDAKALQQAADGAQGCGSAGAMERTGAGEVLGQRA